MLLGAETSRRSAGSSVSRLQRHQELVKRRSSRRPACRRRGAPAPTLPRPVGGDGAWEDIASAQERLDAADALAASARPAGSPRRKRDCRGRTLRGKRPQGKCIEGGGGKQQAWGAPLGLSGPAGPGGGGTLAAALDDLKFTQGDQEAATIGKHPAPLHRDGDGAARAPCVQNENVTMCVAIPAPGARGRTAGGGRDAGTVAQPGRSTCQVSWGLNTERRPEPPRI